MRRLIAIGGVLAAFAVLVGLGVWQLERRTWKHELLQSIDAGLTAPPASLTSAPGAGSAWRPATALGAWAGPPVRIAPIPRNGRAGADYAAALRLRDGGAIVVRLGWAADGTPPPALAAGPVEVAGVLVAAAEPNAFTPDNRPPNEWFWLEPAAIAAAAGLPPGAASPLVLNATKPPAGLDAVPGRPNLPDDHLHYALTWFGLAAALLVVAGLLVRRSRRPAGQP